MQCRWMDAMFGLEMYVGPNAHPRPTGFKKVQPIFKLKS